MEGLGAAASVIAVASIAIQLADSARKLYEFWQAIDEAPASIRAMSTDLKLLTTVLTEISLHEQRYGRNGTVTDVLDSCMYFQRSRWPSVYHRLAFSDSFFQARIRLWTCCP